MRKHLPVGKKMNACGQQQAGDAEGRGDAGGVHPCQDVWKPQDAQCADEQEEGTDGGK